MSLLVPFYNPVFKPTGIDGQPIVGGMLYTYAAGTTNPLPTYIDAQGATPNTNPVVLDANGQGIVYLGSNVYKFVLQDATGVVLWTVDNISAVTITSAASITGVLSLNQLPNIPLSRITLDEDPGTAGWFYQEVNSAGTQQVQRAVLNFLAPLQAADNNAAVTTDVSLGASGVTAGSYTSPNITVNAAGLLIAASNGTPFPSRVDDANGSSFTLPDATIFKWGTSAACPTGGKHGTVALVFPGGAFTAVPAVTCSPDGNADGNGVTPILCYPSNITVNGCNLNFEIVVEVGGGGASNISNTVHACWEAKGH